MRCGPSHVVFIRMPSSRLLPFRREAVHRIAEPERGRP